MSQKKKLRYFYLFHLKYSCERDIFCILNNLKGKIELAKAWQISTQEREGIMNNNKPKPDDRSDNVEKLQEMVQNTIENIEEAHETMDYSSGKAKEQIKAKNKRREEALEGMRS